MGELSLLHALSNVPVYKCTPSVHLYTGTLERAWRRESSPRLVRIWLPWRRTTRRSESTQWREEKMKMRAKNTNLHIICMQFAYDLQYTEVHFSEISSLVCYANLPYW